MRRAYFPEITTCNFASDRATVAPMSPMNPLGGAVVALCSLSVSLLAQTAATTTPLWVTDITIPGAPSAIVPSNRALSIPLLKPADYQGTVRSVDTSTSFSIAGATFGAGQFATAAAPRLVRVKNSATAAHVGRFFLITGNTPTQVTVDLTGSGLAAVSAAVSVGDSVEISPANTIGSIFGNPPPFKAGLTADDGDNLLLWNGISWDSYYWTGTVGSPVNIWKRLGNLDKSNTVIFPDDGVFIVRRGTTPITITLSGSVPSSTEQSTIPAAGATFLANRFPTDTTLGALGLQALPGWLAGDTANSADTVLLWNNTSGAWDTYYWTGTAGTPNNIWKRTGNINRANTVISAGTAVFITHGGAELTLSQGLPYTP